MFLMSSIIVELIENMSTISQKQMTNNIPKDTFSSTRCEFGERINPHTDGKMPEKLTIATDPQE